MAATNRPEILDPALLRPGRFDRQVLVDRPDLKGREAILRVHAKGVTIGPEVDLAAIAAKTFGFVGADLANIVNEAALLAARQGKEAVGRADFDEAIDRVVAGLKKTRVMSVKEREIVATHEAGHAVAAELLPGTDPVAKVSIVSRGIAALGYTQQLPTEDRYLMTRSELFNRLCVLLAGRTAEEIAFGDVSTGAQNDLQRATDLVRHMVAQYGMSEKVGLMTYDGGGRTALLPGLPQPREHSEETARLIDSEASRILVEAHVKVSALLTEQWSVVEQLARELAIRAKIASWTQLPFLMRQATRGVPLQVTHRPPPEIPVRPGVVYFTMDVSVEHWRHVLAERKVAVYAPPPFDAVASIDGVRSLDLHRHRVRVNLASGAGRDAVSRAAAELLEVALTRFRAPDGGFFDTADDAEVLFTRPRSMADNAEPSGQSALAGALLTYSALTGSVRHREAADRAGRLSRRSDRSGTRRPRCTSTGWLR